jgi:hypothetical protein
MVEHGDGKSLECIYKLSLELKRSASIVKK